MTTFPTHSLIDNERSQEKPPIREDGLDGIALLNEPSGQLVPSLLGRSIRP
jgi:hypothetical protein